MIRLRPSVLFFLFCYCCNARGTRIQLAEGGVCCVLRQCNTWESVIYEIAHGCERDVNKGWSTWRVWPSQDR